MKVYADDKWQESRLAMYLFYKNQELVRDESKKNDKLYAGDADKISEANMNFLKDHIKSKEQLYQLMDEYYNDDNTYSVWQKAYASLFERPNEQVFRRTVNDGFKKILADAHEIRTMSIDEWDKHPVFDEYAELINYKDDLLILEIGPGRGRGLCAIAKTLKSNSIIICVDIDFYYVKRVDAIADNLGLSDRMCGYKANFWDLPFADKTFDIVCTCKGLDLSIEINRTIQEISRVLKVGGRFVCNSWQKGVNGLKEKIFFDYLDIPNDEYLILYRKAKMYTGFDDLVDLSNQINLSLFRHKIFKGDNDDLVDVVACFIKN